MIDSILPIILSAVIKTRRSLELERKLATGDTDFVVNRVQSPT